MREFGRALSRGSASAEEAIASVAEARHDVAMLVEGAIEGGAVHHHVGVAARETPNALRRGDETEKADARRARTLERGDGGDSAAPSRKHRVEQEEVTLRRIAGNFEVIVHGLERVVISVQTDVPNACAGDQAINTFDHTEPGAKNRYERELLPAHALADRGLEGRIDRRGLEREIVRRLVRHEHRDLVDQLLEDLRRRPAIAQNGELVLNQRVRDDAQRGIRGGGVHGGEATNFARMKEYQAVILRLTRHTRDDEDALTDLLNERSRGGWEPALMSQDGIRLTVVFQRPSGGEQ
jgi:hypothetical protein